MKITMQNKHTSLIHIPVLLKETIDCLNIKSNGTYLDCTSGFGGHSSKILENLTTGKLYCFDQDEIAIKYLKRHFANAKNVKFFNQNFTGIKQFPEKTFDGIIFDLGVNSLMFDDSTRGFSYNLNGPLDMRMSRQTSLTAQYIINHYSKRELNSIFQQYGEVKKPYRIVDAILNRRAKNAITTTKQLSEIICSNTPGSFIRKHPAKQYFQALRIVVNDELNVLKQALATSLKLLKINGILAVISFHSLEDRIVKQIFNNASKSHDIYDPNVPLYAQKKACYQLINKKPLRPSLAEINRNKRSQSAKLRIIQRVG